MGDLARSLAHYRNLATRYDRRTRRIDAVRLRAVDALALRPGDTALDAGCGTGWCLPAILERVSPGGLVIGFDPSPEMLALARVRMAGAAARVELLQASAEEVVLPAPVDAVLFSYTHDLIRSRPALANILSQAWPHARVAATSTKLYAKWLLPANAYLRATHRGYITDFDGLDEPWSVLAEYVEELELETSAFSQHYIARGRVRPQFAKKT